ncbi:MAG: 2-iminoacetate synthase ThiH [Lentisphaeraceae bacterium]|nr:2-iminoacetate synthase ThiH [Lentisphaeraceae bacterium]
MKTFAEYLTEYDLDKFHRAAHGEDITKIENLLRSPFPKTGAETFALLASPAGEGFIEQMAVKASALTAQRHGKVIRFYAPLYISNECTNTCTYCGFTMENKIRRKSLDAHECSQEAEYLAKRGFRQVLIVSGEHQKVVTPEYVGMMVDECRKLFPSVSIEVAPFKQDAYEMLVKRGVDGLTVYQETYDRDVYKAVHLRGKKKDYDWRLATPERAANAKIRRLNMGVLLGLAKDWRFDSVMSAIHLQYMMKHHWRVQYSVSLPRLCESEADFKPQSEVSDREVTQLILAWRLAFPDLGINISTREPSYLRDGLIGLGVTHMSAESSTEPGGYCSPNTDLKQFDITDERSITEIFSVLKSKNYEAVCKDWEPCMLG